MSLTGLTGFSDGLTGCSSKDYIFSVYPVNPVERFCFGGNND